MAIELNEAQQEIVKIFDNQFDPRVKHTEKLSNSDLVRKLVSLTTDDVKALIGHYLEKNITSTSETNHFERLQLFITLKWLEPKNHNLFGHSKIAEEIALTKQLHQKILELYSTIAKHYLKEIKSQHDKLLLALSNLEIDANDPQVTQIIDNLSKLISYIKTYSPERTLRERKTVDFDEIISPILSAVSKYEDDTTAVQEELSNRTTRNQMGKMASLTAQEAETATSEPISFEKLKNSVQTQIDALKGEIKVMGADQTKEGVDKLVSGTFFFWPHEKFELETKRAKVKVLEAVHNAIEQTTPDKSFQNAWKEVSKNITSEELKRAWRSVKSSRTKDLLEAISRQFGDIDLKTIPTTRDSTTAQKK